MVTKEAIVIDKVPGITLTTRGKVCSANFHLGLDGPRIFGECSPENIGIQALRVVNGRIVGEGRL
jgi:hypothetical protein